MSNRLKAPLDGCPKCLTRNNPPWRSWLADATKDITLYGDYQCRKCSYRWWTGWAPDSL